MRRLISISALALAACPGPKPTPDGGTDGGGLQPPAITSIAPARGKASGGEVIAINGFNFDPAARVFFAAAESQEVVFFSRSKLNARTPPSPVTGLVTVRVQNPDGQ